MRTKKTGISVISFFIISIGATIMFSNISALVENGNFLMMATTTSTDNTGFGA